jgi:RNase H-like domain found in reverse transcriptase/Integrase zinc binding domain
MRCVENQYFANQTSLNHSIYTDASAYGVGAILSQEGGSPTSLTSPATKTKPHPVTYYLATFTETEQKYDIYGQELLAIIKAITHWRPYLIWTPTPFTISIYTDHANLLYWKSPRKLNQCIARWHSELQDYHFTIQHVLGKLHTAADSLSRPPSSNLGKDNNQNVQMIPNKAFQPTAIHLTNEDSNGSLHHQIVIAQNKYTQLLNREMKDQGYAQYINLVEGYMWKSQSDKLVIPPDDNIRHNIMTEWHDSPTARHPGRDKITRRIMHMFHWPGAKHWIANYIKGCTTCQQNKNLTHRQRVLLHAKPFQQVAMDLIMGLPKS